MEISSSPSEMLPVPTIIYAASTLYKDYRNGGFSSQFRLYVNLEDALREKMRMMECYKDDDEDEDGDISNQFNSLTYYSRELIVEIKKIDLATAINRVEYDGCFFTSRLNS
jgi:hypothetical protein